MLFYQQRRRGAAKPGGRGRGIPTGRLSLGPREYHDPPHIQRGAEIWRSGGGRDIPAVLGGTGSWYSSVRAWYSRGPVRAALPVGIPRPRPPGLAAPPSSLLINFSLYRTQASRAHPTPNTNPLTWHKSGGSHATFSVCMPYFCVSLHSLSRIFMLNEPCL